MPLTCKGKVMGFNLTWVKPFQTTSTPSSLSVPLVQYKMDTRVTLSDRQQHQAWVGDP